MHHVSFLRRASLLLLLLVFPVHTCEVRAQAPAKAPAKSCLWKVTSKENAIYLLGSVHILKADAYPLSKAIESAFTGSKKLVLEVSLDAMNSPSAQQLILTKSLLPEGKTLKEALSPETFRLVQQRAESLGLPMTALQRMKPWFLSLSLTVMKMQQLGYDAKFGVDKHFFDRATKETKEVLSLETPDFQINLLDSLPAKTQEASLLQTLRELDQFESEFDQIIRAWVLGNEKKLEESLLESFKEYPDVYEKLINERNRNWLPKIEAFLKDGNHVLIIVGAAHLVGRDGVIELLKQKGYAVEQL
ncbi:MAG: TraB/GumN family protein [Acidobacteria bacterium]|nr:TraB/GumN family protein [Acidobacteriota bacterium]MCI0723768.1 TraB/GumN family protein [Acidobacteriota bacterium]